MTDQERQLSREAKARAIADLPCYLAKLAEFAEVLRNTDTRIYDYCFSVMGDTDAHNVYEILAVYRFLRLLGRYEFSADRVNRFFRFYEKLKFTGMGGRRCYRLTPVQCFQFANIYGFVDEEGMRLTRTAYIFVPRKFSKTTSAAAMCVWDFLFGDSNAQAYVGANSYKQAKICFDEIRNIVSDLDPSGRHTRVNRETVRFTDGSRDALVACLTSNARTGDGLNASLVVMDEYAQARNTATRNGADLKNVLTSSMGARREPLTVIITTASDVLDGPFVNELNGVKAMLRGDKRDSDRIFAHLFMPDADDAEDDERTWHKVQPHIGVTVQPQYYRQAWEDALISGENMMVFRTKLLNIFATNESRVWLADDEVRAAASDFRLADHGRSAIATMGIDLSENNDFTAVSTAIHDKATGRMYFYTDYFIPRVLLDRHPNRRIYEDWAAAGYLHVTDGSTTDPRVIVDYVLAVSRAVKLVRIGYDTWHDTELVNLLRVSGARKQLYPVKQSYGNFTAPTDAMTRGIRSRAFVINDNPINYYCFSNAVVDEDRMQNRKPVKATKNGKIDGVITMLMAYRAFLDIYLKK